MTRLLFILVWVLAQGMALASTPKVRPTPTSGHKIAKTPMDKLQLRLSHQTSQIQRELKRGKLTAAQAKTLKAQVTSIRKTEIADLKTDNSKTLTDVQMADLNGQLNSLSKSVPIK